MTADGAPDPLARAATPLRRAQLTARAYEILTEDDDGRTCDAIPDDACVDVPGNFFLNALNGACTKLAEQIASPGLVLPWLLGAAGAPLGLVGFLVPVKKAGSLLPQLAIAARIRAHPVRKWFWVSAGLLQSMMLAAMIPAVLWLPPSWAGAAVVGLLAAFSVASGVGSVAFKDVLAKTIPQGRRGRLLATRAVVGGSLAVAASLWLRFTVQGGDELAPYLGLLGAAAVLWLLSAAIFAAIREVPGETEGGRTGLAEARAGWHLLRSSGGFRRFVVVRAFLLAAPLSIPFYAAHAQQVVGGGVADLSLFVVASAGASVASSPFWGRFADRDARRVMAGGALWVAATAALAVLLGFVTDSAWGYAPVFLSAGLARGGVRLGRKTYLVDAAPAEARPLAVAVSNTVTGVATVVGGALGLLAQYAGLTSLLAVFGAAGLVGAWLARGLPDVAALRKEISAAA